MTVKEEMLTYEKASLLFSYRADGYLVWKNPLNKTKKAGQVVGGRRKDGRQQVMLSLDGKPYLFLVYRIIWLLHHQEWPTNGLDHINCDPTDDRIENLRDIVQRENNENKRVAQSNNQLGILGVCQHKTTGKYRATINKHGKQLHLGLFETPEEASSKYQGIKKKLHINQECEAYQ